MILIRDDPGSKLSNQRTNTKDVILGQSLSSDAVLSIEMDQPAAAPGWKMVAQTLQRREEGENC